MSVLRVKYESKHGQEPDQSRQLNRQKFDFGNNVDDSFHHHSPYPKRVTLARARPTVTDEER